MGASLGEVAASTRAKLVAAAWELIRDEGVAGATSRRVTELAGANLAAITYHFGSKDALIGEAVVDQLRGWTEPLTIALRREGDDIAAYDERVSAAVSTMLARFATNPDDVRAIVTLVLSHASIPGVREAAVAWLTELRAVATDVMVHQQQAGLVPSSVTPPVMAAVFTAFGLGLAAQSDIDPGAPDTATVVMEFLGLLVRPET